MHAAIVKGAAAVHFGRLAGKGPLLLWSAKSIQVPVDHLVRLCMFKVLLYLA